MSTEPTRPDPLEVSPYLDRPVRELSDVRRLAAMREAGDGLQAMVTHLMGTLEAETGKSFAMTRNRTALLKDAWERAKRHG